MKRMLSKRENVPSFLVFCKTQKLIYFIVFVRKAVISSNMASTFCANSEQPALTKVLYLLFTSSIFFYILHH